MGKLFDTVENVWMILIGKIYNFRKKKVRLLSANQHGFMICLSINQNWRSGKITVFYLCCRFSVTVTYPLWPTIRKSLDSYEWLLVFRNERNSFAELKVVCGWNIMYSPRFASVPLVSNEPNTWRSLLDFSSGHVGMCTYVRGVCLCIFLLVVTAWSQKRWFCVSDLRATFQTFS